MTKKKLLRSGAAVLMAAALTTASFPAAVMADEAVAEAYAAALEEGKEEFIASYDATLNAISTLTLPNETESCVLTLEEGGKALAGGMGLDLSWLENVSLNADVTGTGGLMYVPMTLQLNGSDIVSVKACYNLPENLFYMNCPELSDAWLSMSIDDLVHTLAASMGESAPEGLAEMTNIGPMIVQIAQMIPMVAPTGEEIFNILKDYSSLIFKYAEVTQTEGNTISAAGISREAIATFISFDSKAIVGLVQEALPMIQADENIKSIINRIGALSGSEDESFYEGLMAQFAEETAGVASQDPSTLTGEEFNYSIISFIDAETGEDIGLSFTLQSEGQNMIVDCYYPKEGDTQGLTMTMSMPDGESAVLEGSGTLANGALTGNYTLSVAGNPLVDIAVADLISDETGENVNGTITLKLSESVGAAAEGEEADAVASTLAGLKGFGLTITMAASAGEQTAALTITSNDVPLCTLSINVAPSAEAPEIPTLDSLGTVYDVNDGEAMNNFTANIDPTAIINNIAAAGVPEEFIQQIMSSMTGAAAGTEEYSNDAAAVEGEAPAEEAPAEEAPAEEAPAEEAPAEEAPVEEAPAEEAPVEEEPAA